MLYIPNMKVLGIVVSDKNIFENCILKTYFFTLWPTYATNQNNLNIFCRGPFLSSLVKFSLAVQERMSFNLFLIKFNVKLWPQGRGQFWPQGHNLNNFSRGPLDDAINYTKYESPGPCSFRQEDFWKMHFENLFLTPLPTCATNQNHLNNFCKGPPRDHSCLREEVVFSFPFIIQCKIVTPGRGQFCPQGHNLNNFGRGPLDDAIYQIWKLWAL